MFEKGKEKRRFYRHPVHVPIRLETLNKPCRSVDLSLGGMSFVWPDALTKSAPLKIDIPVKDKLFHLSGQVVHCRAHTPSGYIVGVRFIDYPSAFKARLAEELLQIMEYRTQISRDLGRELTEEEAADRWVSVHAMDFPFPAV